MENKDLDSIELVDKNIYTKYADWSLIPGVDEQTISRWFDTGITPGDLYSKVESEYLAEDYEFKAQLPKLRAGIGTYVEEQLSFLTGDEEERFGLDAKTDKYVLYETVLDPVEPEARTRFGDKPKTEEELQSFLAALSTVEEQETFKVEKERKFAEFIDFMDTNKLSVRAAYQLSDDQLRTGVEEKPEKFSAIRRSQYDLLQTLIVHNRGVIKDYIKEVKINKINSKEQ